MYFLFHYFHISALYLLVYWLFCSCEWQNFKNFFTAPC